MQAVVDLSRDENPIYQIAVAGKPKPLPRHRKSWRKGFYNPASKDMQHFKTAVKAAIPQTLIGPIFGKEVPVVVTMKFFLRRPNSDFSIGPRGECRLRTMLPFVRPNRPDIDNLVKFVLDALNGLLFHDDAQVVKLVAYKLLDTVGACEGRTEVEVSEFMCHEI
jgi:Holliday junction resolvase RusA-like endonuclease